MRRKKRYGITAVIAAAVLAAGGAFVLYRISAADPEETAALDDGDSEPDLIWHGKAYNYNDHLSNYLFLGVDNTEIEATTTGQANAGQADAIYLLSLNRVKGDLTVVTIPRDTITEIETFGPEGESLGMTEDHISLSYAYGDGGHESCRLTKNAVSNLLYSLPVRGYCSVNLEGMPVLTECVGGVTVTVPNDSLESVDPDFRKGEEVTLDGETTELFLRYRDTSVSQSAITRMERQQEYIRAFGETVKERYDHDTSVVTALYNSLEPYMVTNLGSDELVKIMEALQGDGKQSSWTIPGEAVTGESYDEYIVDDDALYEQIIAAFYEEAQ